MSFTPAKDNLSNVDPATGRTRLDVPSNAEAAAIADAAVTPAAVAALEYTPEQAADVRREIEAAPISFISVKDFGAVGDGVADDTAAIQATLTAAGAGNRVHFPAGTYISGPLLATTDGVNISGDGPTVSVIKAATGTTGVLLTINTLRKAGAAPYNGAGVGISNLKLLGIAGTSHGLLANRTSVLRLDRVRVDDFDGDGVRTYDVTTTAFTSVDVHGCANGFSFGYKHDAGAMIGCNSSQNSGWGVIYNNADTGTSNGSNGNVIMACSISQNTEGGIWARRPKGLVISGNYLENNSGSSVRIGVSGAGVVAGVEIRANYFASLGIAIESFPCQKLTVKNNLCEAAATGFLKLQETDSPVEISGNSVSTVGYQLQMADNTTNVTGLTQGGAFSTTDVATGAFRLRPKTSSTTDLVQWEGSTGTKATWINYLGLLNAGDAITTAANIGVARTDTNSLQFLRLVQAGGGVANVPMVAIQADGTTTTQYALYARSKGTGDIARLADATGDRHKFSGSAYTLADAVNMATGTTTGTKIGTATTQKLGFWNATPVVQPAANADTSGASLGELETEVNELKAVLRSVGLMAP